MTCDSVGPRPPVPLSPCPVSLSPPGNWTRLFVAHINSLHHRGQTETGALRGGALTNPYNQD